MTLYDFVNDHIFFTTFVIVFVGYIFLSIVDTIVNKDYPDVD